MVISSELKIKESVELQKAVAAELSSSRSDLPGQLKLFSDLDDDLDDDLNNSDNPDNLKQGKLVHENP